MTGDNFKRAVFDGEQQRFGGGIDIGLRASLFGLFAKDNQLDHWVDLGGAIGGGGGADLSRAADDVRRRLGRRLDDDRALAGHGYPSLVLDVRRQAVTEWDNETLFSVGLAFTKRLTMERAAPASAFIAENDKSPSWAFSSWALWGLNLRLIPCEGITLPLS